MSDSLTYLIHGYTKKTYSVLSATLYHFKDTPGFSMQDAMAYSLEHPDEAWTFERAPNHYETIDGHKVVTQYMKDEA